MILTEDFFKNIFNESRTTKSFNEWWFNTFTTGEFKNKKISAKIDFFPINSLYDEFDDHFTTVLYDPSEENLSSVKAQQVALEKLRKEIQEHFENKMNNFVEEKLPDNVVILDNDGYRIDYGDKEFNGPRNSFAEFIIDIDKEHPGSIKGTLLKTYKLKRIEAKELPWRIGLEGVGRVFSYSGVDNVASQKESPYVDGLNIDMSKNGIHREQVECHFSVKIIAEEPEA